MSILIVLVTNRITYRLYWISLICFFIPLKTKAQQSLTLSADSAYQMADQFFYADSPTEETDQQAISAYRSVIAVYREANIFNLRRAVCHQKIGNILELWEQYAQALGEYHNALQVKQNIVNIADSAFFLDYLYIGNTHHYLENYDSADYYYNLAEAITLKFDSLHDLERLYNSIGALAYTTGNCKQAIAYYTKALSVLDRNSGNYRRDIVQFKNNIAHAHLKLGNYENAITSYNDLIYRELASSSFLYTNLGEAYWKTGQYDSAVYFLNKALSSRETITQIVAHNNLAEVYLQQSVLDSAQFHFNKSISLNRERLNSKNTRLAVSLLGIAKTKLREKELDSALYYYQQSLINTVSTFNDTDISSNPADFQDAISLLRLFEVLQGKGQAFYQFYQADKDTIKLKNALACYQDAIRLAKHIQKSYDTDDAKLFFIEHIYPVFEEALVATYALYELTHDPQYTAIALSIAESSKASVLSETLKDIEIKSTGVVNDSLIKEEKRLKQKITSLRIKLTESSDSVQNQVYQALLTDLEIGLARTIKQLQKDEKYYQLKYQDDTINLRAVQQKAVGPDAVALEYVTGQDALYIFLITKDKVDLKRISINPEFNQTLQQVQEHLYQYQIGRRFEERRSTSLLYQYLLAPYEDDIQTVNRLIIIPDGRLSYIPFEMLSAPALPGRYLIQDYTFNYAYSATLLLDAVEHRNVKLANTVLAMAPFAGKDQGNIRSSGFNLLAASRDEVEKIGGSIYLENEATKRLFLKVASSYGILHLATHASVDSQDPLQSYIAFYPDQGASDAGYRLYTRELYNLKLDSVKLVVLSACETGSGQLVQGEGIISLARAFAYAGCPNIVTTLWKADDKAAAEITTNMHQYLKSGYTKDEALRLAKLDYLNSDIHPVLKSPYYWANFIFIGDPAPIYTSHLAWYIASGAIALILVVLVVFWLVRKRILTIWF